MRLCPVDCEHCTRALCATDGCQRAEAGEPLLMACVECGELAPVRARLHLCIACAATYVVAVTVHDDATPR